MSTEQSRTDALFAHRAKLEREAEEAEKAGNQESMEMSKLLLRQCDFLIQRAEEQEKAQEEIDGNLSA